MERASRVHCKTAHGYCDGKRRAATENQPGSLVGACAPTVFTLVLQDTLLIAEHPRCLAGAKQLLPKRRALWLQAFIPCNDAFHVVAASAFLRHARQ